MSNPLVKAGFSVGVIVVLIGLWIVTATFTGNDPGESCNNDTECKGTDAVCLAAGGPGVKYCSKRCAANSDCPSAEWACERVKIVKYDNKGNSSPGGTEKVCALRTSKGR